MNNVISKIPKMLYGEELTKELEFYPLYDESVRYKSPAERLMALSDIYSVYFPISYSYEIYSKLYLGLIRSFQKKQSKMAIRQQYENYKAIKRKEHDGILGGADSFTIIGASGVGKSTAISKVISTITQDEMLETDEPYSKIIPILQVQCPFDASVKGLLLEILRKVDEILETTYYKVAHRKNLTTDALIGCVANVAINHLGLLVIDEIQNCVTHKNGRNLVGCITQLINSSGISICMVGTPESALFFEKEFFLARRSLSINVKPLEYNDTFIKFCEKLFSYQYTVKRTEINIGIIQWLYEHSNGVLSLVVSLIESMI